MGLLEQNAMAVLQQGHHATMRPCNHADFTCHACRYQVVDFQQDKRVVYHASSDLHSGTHQIIFMPDPNDRSFTVVRYMTNVELKEWRKALQPVVSSKFAWKLKLYHIE